MRTFVTVALVYLTGFLTQNQAKIVLFCLGLAIILLVIGFYKVWGRLSGIEESVNKATENVQELKKKVDSLNDNVTNGTT